MKVMWPVELMNGGIARCTYPGCPDSHVLEDERHWHEPLAAASSPSPATTKEERP